MKRKIILAVNIITKEKSFLLWKQQYVNNEKFVDLKWYLRIDKFDMLHSLNPNPKYDQLIGLLSIGRNSKTVENLDHFKL